MIYTTLMDAQTVREHLEDHWVIVDCRFSLQDTEAGRRLYQENHIPKAVYAHLDDDLSGEPITNQGRHPLPTPDELRTTFSRWGIQTNTQVVVYDDLNGAIASRLWWLLRYMGHDAVAVLDGGWPAWIAHTNYPTESGTQVNVTQTFQGEAKEHWVVHIDNVLSQPLLVDSRESERYLGEVEPLDPVAGHITGAVHYFYQDNWKDGRYLPAEKLKQQLRNLLGNTASKEAVFYCGSGVTACVNLLAQEIAGMGMGKLYAGSWSEWSRLRESKN